MSTKYVEKEDIEKPESEDMMQIVIDIPDEQIKKSLEESKYILEDEGEKGFVNIALLYTNAQLDFVAVERKTDFYDCEYKIIPKGHGDLKDFQKIYADMSEKEERARQRVIDTPTNSPCYMRYIAQLNERTSFKGMLFDASTIIEADKGE